MCVSHEWWLLKASEWIFFLKWTFNKGGFYRAGQFRPISTQQVSCLASCCPIRITVLSGEADIPRRPFTTLAGYFHFLSVFTVAGEEFFLGVLAKFTKQCPDVQLSHFIHLSLGFSKRCAKVEFHLTYLKLLLIC